MENIDYKEIVKRHLEMMNSEYNLGQNEEKQYSNFNTYNQTEHIEKIDETLNIKKENSNGYEIPYFFNFNNAPAPENKVNIETHYVIPGTNSLIKLNICINKTIIESYGKFLKNWKENIIKTNSNKIVIYWHNELLSKSTYDNPIFILLSLIDNKVNSKWIPKYWEDMADKANPNLLKITFSDEKVLILDRSTKKISEFKEIAKEEERDDMQLDDEEQEEKDKILIMKELKMQEIKNSLISPTIEDKAKETKLIEKIDYTNEVEEFKILLTEKRVGITSIYDKELHKLIYDRRYINFPAELRRITFEDYVKSLTLIELKSEKPLNRKEGQEKMKIILKKAMERGDINLKTTFYEFQEKYGEDSSFLQAMPVDREFLFNEAKLKLKKLLEEKKNKNLMQFKEMLNSKLPFDILDENTNYKDIKKLIKPDAAYKLISSKTEKKQIINQYLDDMKKLLNQHKKLSVHNDSLGSVDRKKLLESELAISEFENLLKEKVNKTEISWEEASRKFCSDTRWKNENINESKRMEIFKDYMFNLRENKKKEYRKLLQDKIGLNQEVNWHDAQHMLQNDERYREVQKADRENIFIEYMTYVQEKIGEEFAKFCDECNLITKDLPTDGLEFKMFVNKLNYDIRFQRMYKHPDKRDKLIKNKIKTLKFQFEKQKRLEAKMNNRNKSNQRNTSEPWKKGDVIK